MSDQGEQAFRISPEQERIWGLQQAGGLLLAQCVVRIQGPLDRAALSASIQDLVDRHEILRTTFRSPPGLKVPFQVIADRVEIPLLLVAKGSGESPDEALARVLAERREERVSWDTGPLPHCDLLELSSSDHALIVTLPSMVADGPSLRILVAEVARSYEARIAGGVFGDEAMQYVDFAEWHHELLEEAEGATAGRAIAMEVTELPGRRPSDGTGPFVLECVDKVLPETLVAKIDATGSTAGGGWGDVLTAAWLTTIARSAGSPSVTLGERADGRRHENLVTALGPLARTIPLRYVFDGSTSFLDVVVEARRLRAETSERQYAFDWAAASSDGPGYAAVTFEATEALESVTAGEVTFSLDDGIAYGDRVELGLECVRRSESVTLRLHHDPEVYDESSVRMILDRLGCLLEGAVASPGSPVESLSLMTTEESDRLVRRLNQTEVDFGTPTPVHVLFERRSRVVPDRVAVVCEEQIVTFGALDRRANRIAHALRANGVRAGDAVALYLPRSTDTIAAILGVMKTGAAYVPIDPSLPDTRIEFLLSESGAAAIVTSGEIAELISGHDAPKVALEELGAPDVADHDPGTSVPAAGRAYLIFTSGSTGQPKGVAVEHRQLANYALAVSERLAVPNESSFATVSTFSADLGHTSIFPPLCAGGSVHVVTDERLSDPDALGSYMATRRVDCLKIVPSFLEVLLTASDPAGVVPTRRLIVGGEASRPDLVRRVAELAPATLTVNHYGPTETTVGALTFGADAEALQAVGDVLPIGRPLANVRVYVLDASGEPVPSGVAGEVFIGGAGVARGYQGHPDTTADRFLPDPWSTHGGERLYRTGDLARQRVDGALEFRGRADDQVKIRGYRVELGEIAVALRNQNGVADAVVVMSPDASGRDRLIGYVIAEEGLEGGGSALREVLIRSIPDYMVPEAIVLLEEFPVTRNGKLDRAALPEPDEGRVGVAREMVAPRTPTEASLVGIWAELLGLDEISVEDDFFQLGGHSLLAMRLTLRVRQELEVDLPVHALFEAPTIAGLAALVAAEQEGDAPVAGGPQAVSRDQRLPLSFAQQRLWFLNELDPGSVAYNRPAALRLSGDLDVPALVQSLTEISRRHEILRTTFQDAGGEPVQVIADPAPVAMSRVDLGGMGNAAAIARSLVDAEAARSFDLASGPLVRVSLLRLSDQEHVLLFTQHHIVTDAWSNGVMIQELSGLYDRYVSGVPSALPPLQVQYADFSVWQRDWLGSEENQKQIEYWKGRLGQETGGLELATDRPRPAFQSLAGARESWAIPADLVGRLEAQGREQGATLFMVLLAGFQVLLHRYSGKSDIRVGSPIAGRVHPDVENLLGFFVNTLVLPVDASGDPSFNDFLSRVRDGALDAFANQDVPFEELVEVLQPDRSLSRTPLFETMFVFDKDRPSRFEFGAVQADLIEESPDTSKFDLTLNLVQTAGGVEGSLEYATDLFDEASVRRMLRHYESLLRGIVERPGTRISELDMMEPREREVVVVERNDTTSPYPSESAVHLEFERQTDASPDRIALAMGSTQLTYRQVNDRANRLSRHLEEKGVTPGARVGVCLDRSPDVVIAELAILKCGASYVPMDADYPVERLRFMVADSDLALVVTSSDLRNVFADTNAEALCLDEEWSVVVSRSSANRPLRSWTDSSAYVIYTSGSTGVPKGVEVPHRGVLRLVFGVEYVQLDEHQVVPHLSSPTFDASTLELWAPLLHGGRCVLFPERVPTPRDVGELVRRHGVTTMWLTSSLFNAIIDESEGELTGVQQLLIGGEALSPPHVRSALAALSGTRIINGYGPTENTTFTCCHPITEVAAGSIPIGTPIGNTTVHLVEAGGNPAAIGVPGELCIGGAGLARSYVNAPDLTAERFAPDAISGAAGRRLYQTGDRARLLESGSIEFLGRIDHQVKIRGFRIELGEIEAVLLQHPTVRQAAAMVREDVAARKRLVAYLVVEEGAEVGTTELQSFVRLSLPDHMVPMIFVTLDAMPLTPNGKLDRRALPEPGDERPDLEARYVAPRDQLEELLAGIWSDVLGVDRVGIHDDFFQLGGHSLLATQVISRVRTLCDADLPLRELFERSTIAALAERIVEPSGQGRQHGLPPIERVQDRGDLPLSFAQGRLWFLDRLEQVGGSYNVAAGVRLSGVLDRAALEQVVAEIVRRHESLRTTFPATRGRPHQHVSDSGSVELRFVDLRGLGAEASTAAIERVATSEAVRPFDLEGGPLLRVTVLRTDEKEHTVLFTLHHIVSDGWSMGVLVEELSSLYQSFSSGDPSSRKELPVQYGDYAVWQRDLMTDGGFDDQLSYWRERLDGAPPTLDLPADRPRPAAQTFRGATRKIELSRGLSDAVHALSIASGTTPFMTLLAGFAALLARYSGQSDLVIGTPIAGRHREETEGLIGFLVNTLALRIDVRADTTVAQLLRQVREVALGAYAHQDLPLERLLEELDVERDPGRTPVFQVVFAMQNAPVQGLELPGLRLDPVDVAHETSKFDLTLNLSESDSGFGGTIEYSTDLFDTETVDRLAVHFEHMIEGLVFDPVGLLSEIDLLPASERELVSAGWAEGKDRQSGLSAEEVLPPHVLFERQAAKAPDAVALVYGGEHFTYRTLDRRANALARGLREHGVGPERLVGLCLERSPEMVVGILGILKAGGAYVPFDPAQPDERLAFMVGDAKLDVLLAETALLDRLPGIDVPVLDSSTLSERAEAATPPQTSVDLDNMAYVIYTSGSTGKPKGTPVTHRNVGRLLTATDPWFDFGAEDVWTLFHSYAFDFSVWEIWGALCYGGRLLMVPYGISRSPGDFVALVERERATVLSQTPSAFRQFASAEVESGAVATTALRYVVFGGEALEVRYLAAWMERHGSARPELINMYGITETTVHVTYRPVTESDLTEVGTDSPIGRPIPDLRVLVRDMTGNLSPVGVPGELYVGGGGVARGYLGRPSLTAERFVPDPYEDGARLYRSGDRVRYGSDGSIGFLGRTDDQVKIRGFRIELGEVDAVLNEHEGVREAVVMVREDVPGQPRLVAYVVPVDAAAAGIDLLRDHARSALPDYMVPAAFVLLSEFPLTGNGKLDRKALPEPESSRPELGEAFVAPKGEYERVLAEIWGEVLGLDEVGILDNFFDLGGNSLLLIEVHALIGERLSRAIPVVDLFQFPTIDTLARHLGKAADDQSSGRVAVGVRSRQRTDEPIAVIGMAGRFPGAANIEEFWANLRGGVESIRFFTDEELRDAGVAQEVIDDPNYVKAKGALDDVGEFDASFFGYSAREAELTDPQQRIFLTCAHEALERAGYDPRRYQGAIGVYAGSSANFYAMGARGRTDLWATGGGVQAALASDQDHLPTRVSYKLNLRGPSVNVQTACSTSLVAVHQACRSILSGECDMALAGGVSAKVPLVAGYQYRQDGIVSPDGHCRPFDANAQGTVPGNGVGIVVLKRLSEAVEDGDLIHGIILGTAINNDGAMKVGYTAPSVEGQAGVIATAHEKAGVDPATVGYIEAHGTGTALGDPIEVAALTRAFGPRGDAPPCVLGALKSNVGHLDAAAGVAGLIKTVLAVEHGELPPTLFFEEANPHVDFETGSFDVSSSLQPWLTAEGQVRRAGVSSFGIGGTNAHAVVEQAPEPGVTTASRTWQVVPLSAKTRGALTEAADNLADFLDSAPGVALSDAAYTLKVGRQEFAHRRVVIGTAFGDVVQAIRTADGGRVWSGSTSGPAPDVVFMFPGQGAQYPNMARELYETEVEFRSIVDRCSEKLLVHLGFDLRNVMFVDDEDEISHKARLDAAAERLKQTSVTQPAVFVIELALAHLWMSWGVTPAAMIGHSIGEYVAACISGVLNEDDALRIVCARGRLMGAAPEGAMLAVGLPEAEARAWLDKSISVAAINGPASIVVAGTSEAIAALAEKLEGEEVVCQRLRTSHAFHSALMDEALAPFTEVMRAVTVGAPRIPYASNVTGGWVTADDVADPEYWARQMRGAVRFADGVATISAAGEQVFLEVGPGTTLRNLVRRQIEGSEERTIASLGHAREAATDGFAMARAVARLWVTGVEFDWDGYYDAEKRRRTLLPTYPFQTERYWVEPALPDGDPVTAQPTGKNPDRSQWFYTPSWKRTAPPPTPSAEELSERDWLVFADDSGFAAEVREVLTSAGATVTFVSAGTSFGVVGDDFVVRPDLEEDYEALLAALRANGDAPRDVLHLWTVGPVRSEAGFDEQSSGFHSVLRLARALGGHGQTEIRMTVASTGVHDVFGHEPLHPERSTVLGPCQVVNREYPEIDCRHVDLVRGSGASEAVAGRSDQAGRILAEHVSGEDSVVALRGVHRLIRAWEHVPLQDSGWSEPKYEPGLYLVTGGLGGVGRALAERLARGTGVKLLLTGRTQLPARDAWDAWRSDHGSDDTVRRKIEWILEVEGGGTEIMAVAADVADEDAMRSVIGEAEGRFGRVRGVVHAAGVADGALIPLRSAEMSEEVLAPKVRGTLVLDAVLADQPLDFFVLCSSLASIQAPAGQVAYCAANAFMDAFAFERTRRTGSRTISINWDTWQEAGMAVDAVLERAAQLPPAAIESLLTHALGEGQSIGEGPEGLRAAVSRLLANGLTEVEGVHVFERVLSEQLPQVAVSTQDLATRSEASGDWERALSGEALREDGPVTQTHARPELDTEYAEPANPVEQGLAELWGETLGVSPIGRNDSFFELGGDSLSATQLLARVRSRFTTTLTMAAFFNGPTIAELAQELDEGGGEAERVSELSARVKDMSDDEKAALLARARAAREKTDE